MKEMEEHEVYSALGDDGFTRLTAAFYGQIMPRGFLFYFFSGVRPLTFTA